MDLHRLRRDRVGLLRQKPPPGDYAMVASTGA